MRNFGIFIFIATLIVTYGSCTSDPMDGSDNVPTYDSDIRNITYNYCITCHSGLAPSANLDLNSYQNVRQSTENGNLLNRINDNNNPMPPSGLLTDEQIQLFEDWAANGYPEN